jgi:two-component system, cell cycle response regulator DivK
VTAPPRILVIEDNEANQMLAREVLEADGYEVSVAATSAEALEVVNRSRPALILMDIQLPGEDGLALTRHLKADQTTSAIPIVALTAHVMGGFRERSLAAGCAGYISKPIDVKTFGALVGEYIAQSRA